MTSAKKFHKGLLYSRRSKLNFPLAERKLYYNETTSNGSRTEWSPTWSVIIRVITKSDDRAAGVQFVYHEYDIITDGIGRHEVLLPINRKNYNFREKKNSQVMSQRENLQ